MPEHPPEIRIEDLAEPVLDDAQKAVLAATANIEVSVSSFIVTEIT